MEGQDTKMQEHLMVEDPLERLAIELQVKKNLDAPVVQVDESEWGMAFRVRRQGIRGLLRAFWWGMLSAITCGAIAFIGRDWESGILSDYDVDLVAYLAVMGFFGLSGVTAIAGAVASTSSFVYKSWEAAGLAIANVVFYPGLILGFFLWLT